MKQQITVLNGWEAKIESPALQTVNLFYKAFNSKDLVLMQQSHFLTVFPSRLKVLCIEEVYLVDWSALCMMLCILLPMFSSMYRAAARLGCVDDCALLALHAGMGAHRDG